MRSICCECKILYGVNKPIKQDDETHGYCDQCFAYTMLNLYNQGLISIKSFRKAKRMSGKGWGMWMESKAVHNNRNK